MLLNSMYSDGDKYLKCISNKNTDSLKYFK